MRVGMDHNLGLTDEQDIARYMKRDQTSSQSPPYAIVRDEVVGRHMMATRDIKPGEVIFIESPLTFGPSENTKPICLGCYELVNKDTPCCFNGCGFPMCSKECSLIPEHRDNECKMLKENNYKFNRSNLAYDKVDENANGPGYSMISPLRTLAMKRSNHPDWNLVWMHMSHHEQRQKSDYWKEKTSKIIESLKEAIGLSDPEEIYIVEVILGIHLVNDFEITPYRGNQERGYESTEGVQSIRGLFALASMPSHSCIANATHDFSKRESGFKMTMRSVIKILKGSDITHSYTEPLDPILTRRGLMRIGKFFDCQCKRCSDPTEIGMFTSALICSKCKVGNVIPFIVKNLEGDWQCQKCQDKMSYSKVAGICSQIKKEGELLENKPDVKKYEDFIDKYSGKVLHKNHVFIVEKLYQLAKMYGRMEGYEADVLTDEQLRHKRELCEKVLEILSKIMPGRMRKRAMMMYELHVPLVMLANRQLQRGPSSGANPDLIKTDLRNGLFNLRMSLEILKDEPEGSFEWKIVQGSKESVQQLEDWVKTVCSAI